jgi:hypothetical protein
MDTVFKGSGFCKSMKDRNYELNAEGFPTLTDCKKEVFTDYYTTPESFTLFRALYTNQL